jgi:hypothetical protein
LDILDRHAESPANLLCVFLPARGLGEIVCGAENLLQLLADVHRNADEPGLVRDAALDSLLDPPEGVCRKLVPPLDEGSSIGRVPRRAAWRIPIWTAGKVRFPLRHSCDATRKILRCDTLAAELLIVEGLAPRRLEMWIRCSLSPEVPGKTGTWSRSTGSSGMSC